MGGDAAARILANGGIEVEQGETHDALNLLIAFDDNIASPEFGPLLFMGGDELIRPLPCGINRLTFRFVPRIGEILRRADDACQRECRLLALPQVRFDSVSAFFAELPIA